MKNSVIVIAGPTASGKTSLAVQLAKKIKCEIISADSRQFYRELEVGTAKPTKAEMDGVVHHFVDSHSVTSPISAGAFAKEAIPVLERCLKNDGKVIVVGGSGMFIKALVEGIDEFPHDPKVRNKYNDLFEQHGIEFLQKLLQEKDEISFDEIDIHNPMRLVRALEVIELTGEKFSVLKSKTAEQNIRDFDLYGFLIDYPREELYNRINLRVDQMFENGLIDEVKGLYEFKHLQTLNTVGYKEVFEYVEGTVPFEEAKSLVKRNTRRYAKRQLTWFRGVEYLVWIKPKETGKMVNEILSDLPLSVVNPQ